MKTIRMPKELADKWLAALRSGEFKQGKEWLCNKANEFCCLGVLQQVADGDVERHPDGGSRALPGYDWLESHNVEFFDRFNVSDRAPYLQHLGGMAYVLNDAGASFENIANAIEMELECTT